MSLARRMFAESIGTAALLAIVVGSGIMGEQLAQGNVAIALLANAIATGAGLYVLISVLGPISGAHFNPLVSLMFALRGELSRRDALAYLLAQFPAAIAGVVLANAMFDLPLVEFSEKVRASHGLWISEIVASIGLLLTISLGVRHRPAAVPALVGAYITAAYWFTASTSFANPAVTLARTFSNTFAGIRPADVLAFMAAQLIGLALGWLIAGGLGETDKQHSVHTASN